MKTGLQTFHILGLGSLWLGTRHRPDDVAVPRVGDGEGADPEVLAARGAQLVVVAGVVVDTRLGQHSIVLNLRPGRYILNLRVQQ